LDDVLLLSVILLMGISLILLLLNLYTYKVTKNKKVLIISGLFVIFFVQALLVFMSVFFEAFEFMRETRILLLVDLLAVAVIYAATVKAQ
jgi:hypothetical protein